MAVARTPVDPRRWNQALDSGSRALRLKYDPRCDFFALTLGSPRSAYSHDDGRDILWQIDLETDEVIGLHIDGFQQHYLPRHPQIAAWWQGAKGAQRHANPLARLLATLIRQPILQAAPQPAPPLPPKVARLLELPCVG